MACDNDDHHRHPVSQEGGSTNTSPEDRTKLTLQEEQYDSCNSADDEREYREKTERHGSYLRRNVMLVEAKTLSAVSNVAARCYRLIPCCLDP